MLKIIGYFPELLDFEDDHRVHILNVDFRRFERFLLTVHRTLMILGISTVNIVIWLLNLSERMWNILLKSFRLFLSCCCSQLLPLFLHLSLIIQNAAHLFLPVQVAIIVVDIVLLLESQFSILIGTL